MRKFLTFFVIAAALFFASRTLTVAQTPTPAPASDRVWTTLEFSVCDDASATCSIKNTDTQASRRVQLYVPDTEKLEVNSTTYILQCIDVAGQNLCTSGDATVDNMLYGQDMTKTLNEAFTVMGKDPNASQACMNGYTFEGMTNATGVKLSQPLISTATGDLPEVVEWQSCYRSSMTHFLALNLVQSTTNQTTPAQLSNDGNSTTQQQESETSFTTPVPTVAPTTTSSVIGAPRRIKKEIDPYGIVFDAQTLEPVASAKITLLKKRSGNNFTKVDPYNTEDVTGGALINPYITKEDGYFTFVVKDGTYKLELAKDLNPNLSLVTKESDLDPNYTKVYSNIYPLKTGEEIIQKGKPERRDVAVLISGKKTSNPPKITSNYQELNKKTNKLSVNGRVNQPLAKIRVYSLSVDKTTNKTVRSKLVATGQADKEGYYTISINNNLFGVGEFFGEVEAEKSTLINSQDKANRTSSNSYEPILNYIEGYAYDDQGKIIPEATVGVYLPLVKKPYYQTQADTKGYFKISSINLPFSQYSLKYSLAGKISEATTTDFMKDNSQYLEKTKVNLSSYRSSSGKIVTAPTIAKDSSEIDDYDYDKTTTTQQTAQKNSSLILILIVVVVFLIATTVIVVILYLKKRPEDTLQTPPSAY